MTYRVDFHPEAIRDLTEIAEWVADFAGAASALRTVAALEASIMRLAELPHQGSLRTELGPGVRAIGAANRGTVCFEVSDATRSVRILVVSYAGRDWMSRASVRLSS
jgi:toxin ParE1/3/4